MVLNCYPCSSKVLFLQVTGYKLCCIAFVRHQYILGEEDKTLECCHSLWKRWFACSSWGLYAVQVLCHTYHAIDLFCWQQKNNFKMGLQNIWNTKGCWIFFGGDKKTWCEQKYFVRPPDTNTEAASKWEFHFFFSSFSRLQVCPVRGKNINQFHLVFMMNI